MLSFNKLSTETVAISLALRFRSQRLIRNWSRAELSARAGVAVPTLRRFEDSGKISLDRLLKLAAALDLLAEFDRLASDTMSTKTLADLASLHSAKERQRGRTLGKTRR